MSCEVTTSRWLARHKRTGIHRLHRRRTVRRAGVARRSAGGLVRAAARVQAQVDPGSQVRQSDHLLMISSSELTIKPTRQRGEHAPALPIGVDRAHAALVNKAAKLTTGDGAMQLIAAYLRAPCSRAAQARVHVQALHLTCRAQCRDRSARREQACRDHRGRRQTSDHRANSQARLRPSRVPRRVTRPS